MAWPKFLDFIIQNNINYLLLFGKGINVGLKYGNFSIGAYDDGAAAHPYDLAALKYWGSETILNFPVINSSN